ncbi:MAG: WD40 repeat domain-containing protein [Gemmata sp.]
MHRVLTFAFALSVVAAARAAEPVVLSGHKDAVTGVAFAPDGKTVATTSADKALRLWDAKTGKQLACLDAHSGTATGVAFSADGKRLVTGGYGPKPEGARPQEGEVKVWELPAARPLRAMEKVGSPAEAVTFDPNNRRVAAGVGNLGHVWDAAAGDRKVTFEGHTGTVRGLALDAQGGRLVTASEDGTVRVWHPDSGKPILTLKGHQGIVLAVAVTPNGTRAVSGGQDGSVRVWDIETGKEERKLTAHLGPVFSVAVAPDGKTFASASGLDGTARVWETEGGKEVRVLRLPKAARGPNRVAFAPDGKRLAIAAFDNSVRIYDLTAE